MIVEGILTTTNSAGTINIAPMGPVVHGDFEALTLRPFAGSTTFDNLISTRAAVFHVVDRVQLLAESAIGQLATIPPTSPAKAINGVVLQDCCRWFELQIADVDTSSQRANMNARILHSEERRPYWGLNRARHAIVEAAILATRVNLIPRAEIEAQFERLKSAVEKTGGDEENSTFQMLDRFVRNIPSGAAAE